MKYLYPHLVLRNRRSGHTPIANARLCGLLLALWFALPPILATVVAGPAIWQQIGQGLFIWVVCAYSMTGNTNPIDTWRTFNLSERVGAAAGTGTWLAFLSWFLP